MDERATELKRLRSELEIVKQSNTNLISKINDIESVIRRLESSEVTADKTQQSVQITQISERIARDVILPVAPLAQPEINQDSIEKIPATQTVISANTYPSSEKSTINSTFNGGLEKFIGENLISKLGIGVLILGVLIGAKYSIDNNLISPLMRIVLAYLVSLVLLGFGIKLKEKYTNYSALLVGGSIAIMYIITYIATRYFQLIPISVGFFMLVAITGFSIIASLSYNLPLIAHIGLVGAYAVPFLISTGNGRYDLLFGYIIIINLGILTLSYFRKWTILFYQAFITTWIIYIGWFAFGMSSKNVNLAFLILTCFFVIFYGMILINKLRFKNKLEIGETFLLCFNTLFFAGFGCAILEEKKAEDYIGLFLILNALIHFGVSYFLKKQNIADKTILQILLGFALLLLVITIPIELDGSAITLAYALSAALLYWVGRKQHIGFYQIASFALVALSMISISYVWRENMYSYNPKLPDTRITSIFNVHFLVGLLVALSFASMLYINWKQTKISNTTSNYSDSLTDLVMHVFLPIASILFIFGLFKTEIDVYWHQKFLDSMRKGESVWMFKYFQGNFMYLKLQQIWLMNYTLTFLGICSFIILYFKHKTEVKNMNYIANLLGIFVFLGFGLILLWSYRNNFLYSEKLKTFSELSFQSWLRYLGILLVGGLTFANYKLAKHALFGSENIKKVNDIIFNFIVLVILSNEYLYWTSLNLSKDHSKLSITILWGIYGLILIVYGFWKSHIHLRFTAIALFAGIFIKLFVYDLTHLSSISKTIVFMSLGGLLLVISFLYNKNARSTKAQSDEGSRNGNLNEK